MLITDTDIRTLHINEFLDFYSSNYFGYFQLYKIINNTIEPISIETFTKFIYNYENNINDEYDIDSISFVMLTMNAKELSSEFEITNISNQHTINNVFVSTQFIDANNGVILGFGQGLGNLAPLRSGFSDINNFTNRPATFIRYTVSFNAVGSTYEIIEHVHTRP